MLSFLLPVTLASLAAAENKSVTVCNADQCLKGKTNITNFGATLSTSDTDFILLPGTYTSSVSDSELQKALTSSSSIVSLGRGFSNNIAATAPAPLSLPFYLALQPGVSSYPLNGFVGEPTFISQRSNPNSFNKTRIFLGSFLIAPNTWAAIELSNGSSTSRVVIWDNFPFWSELPHSLAIASSISVKDIQTATCSPTCSSKATCSAQGKCVCLTGFTGTACETCQAGFFGPNCSKCPSDCDKCDDGPSGTGACLSAPLPSNAPSKCNCLNGTCNAGTCTCLVGWANAPNGTACATCDVGFFLDPSSNNCVSCGSGCNACTTTACTTCLPGTVPHPINDPTACILSTTACPAGSFQSGSSCLLCNPLCAECNGLNQTDCTACPATAYLHGGQCLTFDTTTGKCKGTSLVANRSRSVCDTCPRNCAQCSIPNFIPNAVTQDQRQCDQCLPGFVLDNGNCVETCPDGKTVSSDGKTCTACTSGCTTCASSPSFCLTCSAGQSAFNGRCVTSCPTNSFSSNGSCIPCHPDCATCSGTGFNQCKSCPPDLPVLTSEGRCLPTCTRTEYFDGSSGTCKSCDSSCKSCSTGGSSGCLSCASDKAMLRVGKCETMDCVSGSGTIDELGICLAELFTFIDPSNLSGFFLQWWKTIVSVVSIFGGLSITITITCVWRRRGRRT